MGNSAWGNGYHQGLADGLAQGLAQGLAEGRKGRAVVAAVSVLGSFAVTGAALGYRAFKARSLAKREQELSVEDSNHVAVEGTGDEDEAGEGIASK